MLRTFIRKMSRVNVRYGLKRETAEGSENIPCLIVGLGKNINKLTFDDVKHKVYPRVTEEVCTINSLQALLGSFVI